MISNDTCTRVQKLRSDYIKTNISNYWIKLAKE